jgi:hypothetical protein
VSATGSQPRAETQAPGKFDRRFHIQPQQIANLRYAIHAD